MVKMIKSATVKGKSGLHVQLKRLPWC